MSPPATISAIQFLHPVRARRELSTQMLVRERVMPDTKLEALKRAGRRPRAFHFGCVGEAILGQPRQRAQAFEISHKEAQSEIVLLVYLRSVGPRRCRAEALSESLAAA